MSYVYSPFGQRYYPGQPYNTSAFGASNTMPPTSVSFGTTSAALVHGGPQVTNVGTAYAATTTDERGRSAGELQSISAMPIYSGKSHEEIRFESSNSGENASGLFGAPSVSGTTTDSTTNFSTFGSQLGGARIDGTSNNCFRTNSESRSLFGATASAGFGGSSTLFGVSSAPSFGSTYPNIGSNSLFGATASTGFGGSSAPFGVSSRPVFGSSSSNIGSNSVFGPFLRPSFEGSSSNSGSDSLFGATACVGFGGSLAPFVISSRPCLESSSSNIGSNSLFGPFSRPSFEGSSSNSGSDSLFGATASAGFRGSSAPFGVSSGPSFENSSLSFGGNQTATPAFGTAGFGFTSQRKGSRIEAYRTSTDELSTGKIYSLSAMGVYKDKSHEELRLEDYNAGDRGQMLTFPLPSREQSSRAAFSLFSSYTSQNPSTQPISNFSPPQTSNIPFLNSSFTSCRPCVEPTSLSLISSRAPSTNCPPSISTDPFSLKPFPSQTSNNLFAPPTHNNLFSPQTPNNPLPPQTPNNHLAPRTPFTTCPPTSSLTFPSFPAGFSTITLPALRSSFLDQTSFGFIPPQVPSTTCPPTTSSSMYKPIAPEIATSPFAPQPTTNGASVSEALPVVNNFKTCTHCSSLSNPAPELNSFPAPVDAQIPSLSTPWHSAQPVSTTNLQSSSPEVIGPSTSSQGPASEGTVDQLVVSASPFGELPAISRLTISQPGTTISIQYGSSSMPVKDKPAAPIRLPSSLTSRHLSHTRMRLPARNYDSKSEGPKVPFFNKDEERPCVKASSLVPRENLRASVVLTAELWPHKSEREEISSDTDVSLHGNEEVSSENNTNSEHRNVLNIDLSVYEPDPDEVKISKEHIDEIDAIMPQLSLPDYYTEPSITQLAERENAEPGFCSRVNDFEIGRCGYGNIKFLGETDVRNLSLDSLIEFNTREVVVYKNEYEKPPVGEGLNKQAEVTLLNIHCVDKKTGKKYVDGPIVEKYEKVLIKKGEEQGVEFISYDPAKGEWKFKVQHF